MRYTCPNCLKEIEVKMTEEDKKKIMQVLLNDKNFMFELGKKAGKTYFNPSKEADEKVKKETKERKFCSDCGDIYMCSCFNPNSPKHISLKDRGKNE